MVDLQSQMSGEVCPRRERDGIPCLSLCKLEDTEYRLSPRAAQHPCQLPQEQTFGGHFGAAGTGRGAHGYPRGHTASIDGASLAGGQGRQ